MKVAVFVSGRGSNLEALLKAKRNGRLKGVEFVLVFSDNPEARALNIARDYGIKTAVIDPKPFKKDRESYDGAVLKVLRENGIEFIVLAGYMRLLSRVLLEAYPLKIINIHPALLPAFPGLHAQRKALEYGVKVSGCTVHFVDEGVDSGPVIAQAVVPVLDDDDEDSLSARILRYEHQLLPKVLEFIAEGKVRVNGRRVIIKDPEWEKGIRLGTLGPVQ
ncbi:MAG: phosphoribosylglycinamide formyltransferase [Candidatus Sumerlaeia bacterium]|nr:phosphoribosylglycinamide formyltransferase [Candidatus Sumerlaeia bacterium]